MMITPPVAAAQAGQASGGGIIDTFKNAISGATGGNGTGDGAAAAGATQTSPTTQASPGNGTGDGSVGLFDGVWKKALLGGAAGAVMGFLPFIPGGPILGGVVGALGGVALGVFGNWRNMKAIKAENQATIAAMGVQSDDPRVQQILQTGQVQQLVPLAQEGLGTQTSPQGAATQTTVTPQQQAQAVAQGQLPQVVDPAASALQSPVPTQGAPGQVLVGSGASTTAINPNTAVDPGIAPAAAARTGGGGSAGDAGRPLAPAGVQSDQLSAIQATPAGIATATATAGQATAGATQAAVGVATATTSPTAAAGADLLTVDPSTLTSEQLAVLVTRLQQQIDEIQAFLAAEREKDAARTAGATTETVPAAA